MRIPLVSWEKLRQRKVEGLHWTFLTVLVFAVGAFSGAYQVVRSMEMVKDRSVMGVSTHLGMMAIGFVLGTTLMVAFGVSWSWVVTLVGVVVAIALAVIGVVGDLPDLVQLAWAGGF